MEIEASRGGNTMPSSSLDLESKLGLMQIHTCVNGKSCREKTDKKPKNIIHVNFSFIYECSPVKARN